MESAYARKKLRKYAARKRQEKGVDEEAIELEKELDCPPEEWFDELDGDEEMEEE